MLDQNRLEHLEKIVGVLVTDISDLKFQAKDLLKDQQQYQKVVVEFMARNDKIQIDQTEKLNQLLNNAAQWSGARKLFLLASGAGVAAATIVSAWAAWISAHLKVS